MSHDKENNLNLIGKNEDDLKVISAYLQDSIVKTKNIVFLEKNRTFIMILNRFMWEDAEKGVFRKNKRIRCAVKFEEIFEVKSKNINQKKTEKPLEFLAIKTSMTNEDFFNIKIFFSGGGIITLTSEIIEVLMNDLGRSWNVKYFPSHKFEY